MDTTIQPAEAKKFTVADLIAMPDDDKRYELIDGEIIEMGTSSLKHSVLGAWLIFTLMTYIQAHQPGGLISGADGTYRLDDDNVRVPDISYITAANLVNIPAGSVFTPFAPDFAIEIKSPSQSTAFMRRRARQYIQAGTRLVWVIDFEDQSVLVHRPGHPIEQFAEEDVLDGGDILPGLTIRLADLFAVIANLN
jgi:Uma2 family endonuclease